VLPLLAAAPPRVADQLTSQVQAPKPATRPGCWRQHASVARARVPALVHLLCRKASCELLLLSVLLLSRINCLPCFIHCTLCIMTVSQG
jgi:hypothetical protein